MSADRPKTRKLWGGAIEYEEPKPNDQTEKVKAAIDAGLKAFETHKDNLLGILQDGWERGPKSEHFNADRAWRHLTGTAQHYSWRAVLKQRAIPAADRVKRLEKLAKALAEARRLVDNAMQDELSDDLFSAWYEQNVKLDLVPKEPVELAFLDDEFDKVVAALSPLEEAARKACDECVRAPRNRPKGSAVLPPEFVDQLVRIYQEGVGLKLDKPTDHQFVRFVHAFLVAIGVDRKVSQDYALEAIKYTLRLDRKRHRFGE